MSREEPLKRKKKRRQQQREEIESKERVKRQFKEKKRGKNRTGDVLLIL